MKVFFTAMLTIDLDRETWECAGCGHEIGSARDNYKKGLLVRERAPEEIHAPVLDTAHYEFTFAPDGDWCRILEYCCPDCGRLAEVEYLPPGHPPAHDIEIDIDALKAQWATREPLTGPVLGPEFVAPTHSH
jgi:acetone carboxylase gamma subunit